MSEIKDAIEIETLKGLSTSSVKLFRTSEGEFIVVKKLDLQDKDPELHKKAYATLKTELNFYLTVPINSRKMFPEILSYEICPDNIHFIMPFYYNGHTMENLLENTSVLKTSRILLKDLCFLLYETTLQRPIDGDPIDNYLFTIRNRIRRLDNYSMLMLPISDLLNKLTEMKIMKDLKKNSRISLTHGDLTMKNILVDPNNLNNYKLIDVHPFLEPDKPLLSDPAEDLSRLLAYAFPIYPVKYSAISWRGSMSSGYCYELNNENTFYKCLDQVTNIFWDKEITKYFEDIYPEEKFQMRVFLLWMLNVLRVALDRLEDGNEAHGIGYFHWALKMLYNFTGENFYINSASWTCPFIN